ncbi:MAG: Gx transporter family protein [Chitinivibrionales bacterium]|nr:Gx transporter family protein [Chitinivibrionales bacterium]
MQSADDASQGLTTKTVLLLLGLCLSSLEFFIPRIPVLPWLKPGLGNVITLVWIIRYGFSEALLVAFLRVWIVSFYFGFSFLTFLFSMGGSLVACMVMAVLWTVLGKRGVLGAIGISIAGAGGHNCGQLGVVYLLLGANENLLFQLPFMIAASVVFGAGVGFFVPRVIRLVPPDRKEVTPIRLGQLQNVDTAKKSPVIPGIFFGACIICIFINSPLILIWLGVTLFVVLRIQNWALSVLWYPLHQFGLLFIVVGTMSVFFTPGTVLFGLSWMTVEGMYDACIQLVKLYIWIQTSLIFHHWAFHDYLLEALKKLFARHHETIMSGVLSTYYFPSVVHLIQSKAVPTLKVLFSKPTDTLAGLISDVYRILEKPHPVNRTKH